MTNSGSSPKSVFSSHCCILENFGSVQNEFKNCMKESKSQLKTRNLISNQLVRLKKLCESSASNHKLIQILAEIMNSKASEEEIASRRESLQKYLGWKFKTWGSTMKKFPYNCFY